MPEAVPVRRNPIGTHVTVGRGLVAGALASAERLGCEAFQVFTGNPRGWALSPGDPRQDRAFREATAARGLRVFVHAPYLVNLGSPTPTTRERSAAAVAHTLGRAAAIGAEGVVVHTGSFVAPTDDPAEVGRRHATAMRRVREALLPLLDRLDEGRDPWLLLEPTAGQGRSLCAGVEDLGPYLDALDRHPRAGVCLDTCHAFAAGAPLDVPGGGTATLDRVREVAGPGRLRLVHANDSQDPRGSLRDRHERIGEGHVRVEAFAEMLAHPTTAGVPFVLETPGSREPHDPGTRLLRSLRARVHRDAG